MKILTNLSSASHGFVQVLAIPERRAFSEHLQGNPPTPLLFQPDDVFMSRHPRFPSTSVPGVLNVGSFTKIRNPVIGPDSINVVETFGGESTVGKKPRQSVSQVCDPEDRYSVVTMDVGATCAGSKLSSDTTFYPSEVTGFRVVAKMLFQGFLSQIVLGWSHSSKSKGQRREVRYRHWPFRDRSRELVA